MKRKISGGGNAFIGEKRKLLHSAGSDRQGSTGKAGIADRDYPHHGFGPGRQAWTREGIDWDMVGRGKKDSMMRNPDPMVMARVKAMDGERSDWN